MRGYTLIELTAVLSIVAAASALLAPAGRAYRDRAAVVAAREAVAGLLSEARVVAMRSGRASVRVEAGPWRARLLLGDSVLRAVPLESDLGVAVRLGGGRTATSIVYDALGLGRFASETLRFTRGEAAVRLVVSGYGRVRRD